MKIAIIGSGGAGIIALRALRLAGFKFIKVFEKEPDLGGVWRYSVDDSKRPLYRGLRTNLPREIMAYRSKPWGGNGNSPSFVAHGDVQQYLKNYAKEFSLEESIQLNCEVTNMTMNLNDVSLASPCKSDISSKKKESWPKIELDWFDSISNKKNSDEFDAVIVCNGHYSKTIYPVVPGLDENFKGKITHSIAYDNPFVYKDLVVLCVGGRASGSDLTREISQVAKHVFICDSAFPKEFSGVPQTLGNVTYLPRLMKYDSSEGFLFHDCQICLNNVDCVIFCTGYDYHFPFITPTSNLEFSAPFGERRVSPLYEQIWHVDYPNLCFIGLQHSVLPFPLMELQAEAIAHFLKVPDELPPLDARLVASKEDFHKKGPTGARIQDTHFLGPYQWDYCRKIAKLAGIYDSNMEHYISTNKAIYDDAGKERKSLFPGGPDTYRNLSYIRNDSQKSFKKTCF